MAIYDIICVVKNKQILILKKLTPFLLLAAILGFAFLIRINTFWISHWSGDQCHYLCLAMKLEKGGLKDYNLRGLDVFTIELSKNEADTISLVFPTKARENDKGMILNARVAMGLSYYDVPLFQNAPGFPLMLMLSHKLFSAASQPHSTVLTRLGQANKILAETKPKVVFQAQFFAVIVPLFFSILTIALIFFMGRRLFSEEVGLYAAFIYAIDPVNIFTSQRIWADDMLTFFIALSVFIFMLALDKEKPAISLLGGLACGIGILAKQTALIIVPVIWVFTILLNKEKIRSPKDALKIIFNPYIGFFLAGAVIISGFWFYKVYSVYGTPFFTSLRDLNAIAAKDASGWHKAVAGRPHPFILYPIGILYLCPIILLSILSVRNFILAFFGQNAESLKRYQFVLPWIWIGAFYLASFAIGKEHRYMMPAHPPLVILSAFVLNELKTLIRIEKFREIFILILLAACTLWSLPIGLGAVMQNQTLIMKPF